MPEQCKTEVMPLYHRKKHAINNIRQNAGVRFRLYFAGRCNDKVMTKLTTKLWKSNYTIYNTNISFIYHFLLTVALN